MSEPLQSSATVRGSSEEHLREALVHTIVVLEQTRRSFKSRQLEALRKELLEVLARA